jgi:hypothetical protein
MFIRQYRNFDLDTFDGDVIAVRVCKYCGELIARDEEEDSDMTEFELPDM